MVKEQYICRIAFKGEDMPVAFFYVFDGRFMYFLSTNYGRKVQNFRDYQLTVEIENYSPDLSTFGFVALPGRLVEIDDVGERSRIRESFVNLIKSKGLSSNVLSPLAISPKEPIEARLAAELVLVL